jgi:hypothetical protein
VRDAQAQDAIKAGDILIREGILLPQALRIESGPYVPGWRLVENFDGRGLDRAVREAGWTFFFLAGKIKATAFGFNRQKMVRSAIRRILANPKSKQFNSLEITEVASKRFLGVPYVIVTSQSRHIQESLFLFSPERIRQSDRTRPAAARTQAWGLARAKGVASEAIDQAAVATTPSL